MRTAELMSIVLFKIEWDCKQDGRAAEPLIIAELEKWKKQIQLDAFKSGMRRAAEIVHLHPLITTAQNQQREPNRVEMNKTILAAADKVTPPATNALMLACADYWRTKANVIRHDSQESAWTRHYDAEADRCEARAVEWKTKPLTTNRVSIIK